jgi:hypothetical protein
MQDVFQKKLTGMMKDKLSKKPWVADVLVADFPVGCKRLTPGPGVWYEPEGVITIDSQDTWSRCAKTM